MYLLGGFEGMLICGNVGKWRNLKCILIRFFPSENSRNLHLLHKNNAIAAKPLLGSLGKE